MDSATSRKLHRRAATPRSRSATLAAFATLAALAPSTRAGAQTHGGAGGARTITRDGVLSFVLRRDSGTVTVLDLLNRETAATTHVCAHALSGSLTADDVAFVVHCAGAKEPVYVNTASYAVVPPPAPRPPATHPASPARKNEVLVVGTIHGEHRTSTRYSTTVLRDLLRALKPDYVLTEIPPNRFDAAMSEFTRTGTITEPRVVRFPEYVDVLFPLTREMTFTIIPTAGWTRPMDASRTAALERIGASRAR